MAYVEQTWSSRWGRNLLAATYDSNDARRTVCQRFDHMEEGLATATPSYVRQWWDTIYGRGLIGGLWVSKGARDAVCIRFDYVEAAIAAWVPGYTRQTWATRWGVSLVGAWASSAEARDVTCGRLDHMEDGLGVYGETLVRSLANGVRGEVWFLSEGHAPLLRAVRTRATAAVASVGEYATP